MRTDANVGFARLARTFVREYPDQATRHLDDLPVAEISRLVRAEPLRHAVPVMERLEPNLAAEVLGRMPADVQASMVGAMDPMRAIPVLNWINDAARDTLIGALDPALARELRIMADYPVETAGRLMDPRVLAFKPGTTVRQALARLRAVHAKATAQPVSDVFFTDAERRLTGTVSVQQLVFAEPNASLETLVRPAAAVQAIDPQDEIVEHFKQARVTSLPVVDFEGRLLGVIRYDTLAQTAQEDVAADMLSMVGASRQERALSPVSFAVKKRLPWLEINLATAFLAASVVGIFKGTIARFTQLAVLLPVVAGQAGNTGAQALAVTMRGLAMREIRMGQWPSVVRKEAGVALVNGIAVSLTTAGGVWLWSRSTGLALVIGISMVLSMVAAGVAGVLVPTALTMVGQDPAQSSSIILTTVTDIVGFASFLGIATMLSGML